jgi:hypothetical protein
LSVDFQTPLPNTASALLAASPVQKYMILGLAGFWQINAIAKIAEENHQLPSIRNFQIKN